MQSMDDSSLLRQFVETGSDTAFSTLVERHLNLVYSVAVRCVGDHFAAQEVAQSVFILLARKASMLRHERALSSWLFEATRLTARNCIRSEARRHRRELEAHVKSQVHQSGEELWPRIAPILDEAVAGLKESDRRAILLRFYEGRSLYEIGGILEASEEAVRKRISRAVDHLRVFFAERGITIGTSALVLALSTNAVQAAPVGLASSISLAALPGATLSQITTAIIMRTIVMTTKYKFLTSLIILSSVGLVTYEIYRARFTRDDSVQVEDLSEVMSPAHVSNALHQPDQIHAGSAHQNVAVSKPVVELDNLKADLRRALYSVPRSKFGTRAYPPEDVLRILRAFGPDRKQALGVILEGINAPDLETRMRAVSTLGILGKNSATNVAGFGTLGDPAPEAKSLCWRILLDGDKDLAPLALSSLRTIKLEASDMPGLVKLLAESSNHLLRRYLPETIAETILSDPDGAAPAISELDRLLDHQDPKVQFGAACALAQHQAVDDSKILRTLLVGLTSTDTLQQLMALETLQRLKQVAEPAIQAIRDFGDRTTDESLKEVAFVTLGKIREDLRSEIREVDQVLKREETIADWNHRFDTGSYTRQDLFEALKHPSFSVKAATILAEMGPQARDAVPAMIASLTGQDQSVRERIVEAIQRLDPQAAILTVPYKAVFAASLAAIIASKAEMLQSPSKPLVDLLEKGQMGNSEWQTQQEVVDLATAIAKQNSKVYRVFAEKLVSEDPKLASVIPRPAQE